MGDQLFLLLSSLEYPSTWLRAFSKGGIESIKSFFSAKELKKGNPGGHIALGKGNDEGGRQGGSSDQHCWWRHI